MINLKNYIIINDNLKILNKQYKGNLNHTNSMMTHVVTIEK